MMEKAHDRADEAAAALRVAIVTGADLASRLERRVNEWAAAVANETSGEHDRLRSDANRLLTRAGDLRSALAIVEREVAAIGEGLWS